MFRDTEIPSIQATASRFAQEWREDPPRPASLRYLSIGALVFLVYFIAGKLSLHLAYLHPSVSPVWPPSGIALAAFLLFGSRLWPAVFLAAFCINFDASHSVLIPLGITSGNTMEAFVGAYLVQRFAGRVDAFERLLSILHFTILAALASTLVSATAGVVSLWLGHQATGVDIGPMWLTWWLGDAVGVLVVAPIILLSFGSTPLQWNRKRISEAVALGLYLLLVGAVVFGQFLPSQTESYPLEFLCIPFLIWAALRFGQLEAAVAILFLAAVAIAGTLHGHGPFARVTPNDSLLILQAFVGVVALMTHAVAAVVAERHRAVQALREARDELAERAISDPLTGLANYRHFVDVFEGEVERSYRTKRPFALVVFDLDDLKKINDAHGHLVGTRALCRVGNTMRVYCRAIDTAVRYGGDEFALLLPETKSDGAHQVARRIAAQVAGDGECPSISVSFGIAVSPQDGRTIEEVFGKADAALYAMKRRHLGKV